MDSPNASIAEQIAYAAIAFQSAGTGHSPSAVSVVLSMDTLVITMHGALSPGEVTMAQDAVGAARIQEYHRQLFANSSEALRLEIKRITGVDVRECAAEIETTTGTVVHAFTTGTMVQVFLLTQNVPAENWSGRTQSKLS
jgi:uncharacterized protein YbcI